jgi:hypothetical protein
VQCKEFKLPERLHNALASYLAKGWGHLTRQHVFKGQAAEYDGWEQGEVGVASRRLFGAPVKADGLIKSMAKITPREVAATLYQLWTWAGVTGRMVPKAMEQHTRSLGCQHLGGPRQ